MFKETPAIETPPESTESTESIETIETTDPAEPKVENEPKRNLREGVYPIMTCLGTKKDFGKQFDKIKDCLINPGAQDLKINAKKESLEANELYHDGHETYVMSKIDGADKASKELRDCTGCIAVGIDKETGENISFMIHQDPKKFLKRYKKSFLMALQKHLFELKNRCEPETIDVLVFGGNFLPKGKKYRIKYNTYQEIDYDYFIPNYLNSIKLLSNVIKESLGFDPKIIGPKLQPGDDIAYFDTANRRLYLVRPEINIASSTVSPEWIEEMGKPHVDSKKKSPLK